LVHLSHADTWAVPGLTAYAESLTTRRGPFNSGGFNEKGFDREGFQFNGFNAAGINRAGQSISDFPPEWIKKIAVCYERAVATNKIWTPPPVCNVIWLRSMYPEWYRKRDEAFPEVDQESVIASTPGKGNKRNFVPVKQPTHRPDVEPPSKKAKNSDDRESVVSDRSVVSNRSRASHQSRADRATSIASTRKSAQLSLASVLQSARRTARRF
jgi:hypothetical protein